MRSAKSLVSGDDVVGRERASLVVELSAFGFGRRFLV